MHKEQVAASTTLLVLLMAISPGASADTSPECQPPAFVPPQQSCDAGVKTAPGGPLGKGEGSALEFCTSYPWFCRSQRPYGCRPSDPCNWHCETRDQCGRLASLCSWQLADAPDGEVGGGLLGVLSPSSGSRVGRQIEVVGFAHAFFQLVSVSFALDGRPVVPSEYFSGFCVPAACQPPWGIGHSQCRAKNGFRAVIDLGPIAPTPGRHSLQIFAYSQRGLPGVLDLPLIVDPDGK